MLKRDLTGERFGKLLVIKFSGRAKDGHALWLCKCDCGNMKIAQGNNLVSGNTTNCGCQRREKYESMILGHKFGRLTPIRSAGKGKYGDTMWECVCDCGNHSYVSTSRLLRGKSLSCGCYSRDVCIERSTKHNGSHRGNTEKLYRIWNDMKRRCSKEYRSDYERYGGRGITVCSEWQESYETFRDWAMSHGYKPGLSIDRIDNNNGYSPDNCRWETMQRQANNKRNNRVVEVNGEKMTLADACRSLGLKYGTIHSRLRRGWTESESLFGRNGR